MKKKLGTTMDEDLIHRAKLTAKRDGITLSKLIENALTEYLEMRDMSRPADVVNATWGAFQIDPEIVRTVMEEEGSYLDV